MRFEEFLKDEEGMSEEIFKLAMVVIVMAAVLVILASVLNPVGESANESATKVSEGMETMADKTACEMKDCTWDSSSNSCSC